MAAGPVNRYHAASPQTVPARTWTREEAIPLWVQNGMAVALLVWAAARLIDTVGDAVAYKDAFDPVWNQWISQRLAELSAFAVGLGFLWLALTGARLNLGLRATFAFLALLLLGTRFAVSFN